MGWGTSWDKPEVKIGVDLAKEGSEKTILSTYIYSGENKFPEINHVELRVPNKFPTHDPYTNPNAFLYYECGCGNKLDPHVKSFAALNNAASNANWKVRWGPDSYVPYCPKCVEEKGIE